MVQYIDSKMLKDMVNGAYQYLSVNKNYVDSLNVFPVPDGDTGTNMSLTMSSVHNEVMASGDDMEQVATAIARGALKGARGNSGVILSQIFKGITNKLKTLDTITAKDFAEAMKNGTEIAYSAVTKPKEGTILTVIRVMSEFAISLTKRKNIAIDEFFEKVLEEGEKILAATPEMLPVLKKAGVVDAGGRGLLCIFYGFYNILAGLPIPEAPEGDESLLKEFENFTKTSDNELLESEDIKFAYCTEFFITNLMTKVTESDIDKLRELYMTIGDCVLVIGDLAMVKVHVHTNTPDVALKAALKLGELDGIKIENMVHQNRAIQDKRQEQAPKVDRAIISICAGEGMANIFKDFGVEYVVEGGQTMNPSVEDILSAIKKVNADNVIIFPNNKNIILAANQAKELATCNVYVVPTTCVQEGISASLVYAPDKNVEAMVEEMNEEINRLACGQVTYAVRNTKMNGFSLKEGDIIGLDGKKIIAKGSSVQNVVSKTIEKLYEKHHETITLYYGNGVTEQEAQELVEDLEEEYEDMDIVAYYGGQPHYYYLIALE